MNNDELIRRAKRLPTILRAYADAYAKSGNTPQATTGVCRFLRDRADEIDALPTLIERLEEKIGLIDRLEETIGNI